MVRPGRIERPTLGLEVPCSIQLSYGRMDVPTHGLPLAKKYRKTPSASTPGPTHAPGVSSQHMANARKGVLRGPKIGGDHQTMIEAAVPLIQAAKDLPEVTKIVIGEIRPLHSGEPRLKYTPVPAGLKLAIRGANAIQTVYVYTTDPAATTTSLRTTWEETH